MILQYIVPGYVCYILFIFTTSGKNETKSSIAISCVISYLLLTIISLLRTKFFKELPDTAIINSALSSICGILITTIVSIIYNSKRFKLLTVKLFHKTPFNNIWRDIFDLESGSNLKVYLKGKDYYIIGHHKNHEETGDNSWLALSAFAKFDKNTNSLYENAPNYLDREDVVITVRLSDVEHMEIF